jgi:hypothetical protein
MFPNMLLKVTVVNFIVPGVIFDFASFSFQVPMFGSAAKHAAAAKKQNARVNPIDLIFMCAIETGCRRRVNTFLKLTSANRSSVGDRFYRPRLWLGSR